MSYLTLRVSGTKIDYDVDIFGARSLLNGEKHAEGNPGSQFGGTSGWVLLGPDDNGKGGSKPTAIGEPWDSIDPSKLTFHNYKKTYGQKDFQGWVRGHLINQHFGGSGDDWKNLSPFTYSLNNTHRGYEKFVKVFLEASRIYEKESHTSNKENPNWYGVYYSVQTSKKSFLEGIKDKIEEKSTNLHDDLQKLFRFAPNSIRVSWRAVSIQKPKEVKAREKKQKLSYSKEYLASKKERLDADHKYNDTEPDDFKFPLNTTSLIDLPEGFKKYYKDYYDSLKLTKKAEENFKPLFGGRRYTRTAVVNQSDWNALKNSNIPTWQNNSFDGDVQINQISKNTLLENLADGYKKVSQEFSHSDRSVKELGIKTKHTMNNNKDITLLNSFSDNFSSGITEAQRSFSSSFRTIDLETENSGQPNDSIGLLKQLVRQAESFITGEDDIDLDLEALNTSLASQGIFGDDDGFSMDGDYEMRLKYDHSLATLPFTFDSALGLESLGLRLKGDGIGSTQVGLELRVGMQSNGGFGLISDDAHHPLLGVASEIAFNNLDIDLGFLKLKGTHQNESVLKKKNKPSNTPAINLKTNIGLKLDDNGKIKPSFTADVEVYASVEVSTNLVNSELLPKFSADLDYKLAYDPIAKKFVKDSLTISNTKIDIASLMGIAQPMVDKAKGVVNQFKPVVDFLTAPIPGLDQAGINISILDLAKSPFFSALTGRRPLNTGFLEAIPQIDAISRGLDQLQATGVINLGGLTLTKDALAGLNPRSTKFDALLASAYEKGGNESIKAAIQQELQKGLAKLPNGTSKAFTSSAGKNGDAYFEFSLLKNPSSAIGLMMGDPTVDLFRFGLPGLDLNVSGEIRSLLWPIPPVSGVFGGSIQAEIAPLHFAYDATGIQKLIQGGSFADLAEGFYIDTQRDLQPGLTLDANLYLKGEVGIPRILLAGAQADVRGNLSLLLNDPNDDGRIRALEVAANFNAGGIGNVFDINGSVTFGFSVYIEYLSFSFSQGFTTDREDLFSLGPIKLLDLSRPGGRGALPLNLGRLEDTTLRLNVGAFAVDRTRNNEDVGERFSLASGLQVAADGIGSQSFSSVQRVSADFGDGQDRFDGSAVAMPLSIIGGLDDDTLIGGVGADSLAGGLDNDRLEGQAGADSLVGEAGNDSLLGGDAADTLYGGEDNDSLSGGAGSDTLKGEDGDDQLDGETENDFLFGGSGNDTLFGGENDDDLAGEDDDDSLDGGDGADTLRGGPGSDQLQGAAGVDKLFGDDDDDRLQGDIGNDTLDGGSGDDELLGGVGDDSLSGGAGQDVLLGDDSETAQVGNDNLRGDADNDTLRGFAGADDLDGGSGDDLVEGGAGDDKITDLSGGLDTLQGGEGKDTITGGSVTVTGGLGWDVMIGGAGADNITAGLDGAEIQGNDDDDLINGSDESDLVMAGSGQDEVYGRGGDDLLHGSSGNDLLLGDGTISAESDGDDEIFGEEGSDTLFGGGGNDELDGGVGEDRLEGGTGNDELRGGDHTDVMLGGLGLDTLEGEEGDDDLQGEANNDVLSGGEGNDKLVGGLGNDDLSGDEGADRLDGSEGHDSLFGGDGNDTIAGSIGNDSLSGDDGTDSLEGGLGQDTLEGGDGNDVLRGKFVEDIGEQVSLDGADMLRGQAGRDELWGNEGNDTLEGGDDNDLLMGDDTDDPADPLGGNSGNDILWGGKGDDTLFGGLGNDTLAADVAQLRDNSYSPTGSTGFDRLIGGYGNDRLIGHVLNPGEFNTDLTKGAVFVLSTGSGMDTILHFNSNLDSSGRPIPGAVSDVIQLTNGLSFGSLGIEEELRMSGEFSGRWHTSLIDLDTNQVLAELVDIRKAQIGRNNIDEKNVPPDRLRLQSEKPIYAKKDEFRLVEGKVRDPNGANDIDTLSIFLRKPDGTWQDWHDLGLMGVVKGRTSFATLTIDGRSQKFLLVSGESVAELAKGQTAAELQLDQQFERRPVSRIYRQESSGQWMEVFLADPVNGTLSFRSNQHPVPSLDPASGLPNNGLSDLSEVDARFVDVDNDGLQDLARIGRVGQATVLDVFRGTTNGFLTPIRNQIFARGGQQVAWAQLFGGTSSPKELIIDGEIYSLDKTTFTPSRLLHQHSATLLRAANGSSETTKLTGMNRQGRACGYSGPENNRIGLVWSADKSLAPRLLPGIIPIATTGEADSKFWGIGKNNTGQSVIFQPSSFGNSNEFIITLPTIQWPAGAAPTSYELTDIEIVNNQRRIIGFATIDSEPKGFQLYGATPHSLTASWLNNDWRLQPRTLSPSGIIASKAISQIVVNTTSHENQDQPAITRLKDGRIVVTWTDSIDGSAGLSTSVRAQILSASGKKISPQIVVSDPDAAQQSAPVVSNIESGGFMISWLRQASGSQTKTLQAQVFNANGIKDGSVRSLLSSLPAGSVNNPLAVVSLANSGFVVIWTDSAGTGADQVAIRGQLFHADGLLNGGAFLVKTTKANPPAMVTALSLTNDTFIVVWSDGNSNAADASGSAIHGQIYSLNGSKIGNELLVNSTTPGDQTQPAIALLANGDFLVAWIDHQSSANNPTKRTIRGRRFSPSGTPREADFVIRKPSRDTLTQLDITSLTGGSFVVSWRNATDSDSIRGQMFNFAAGIPKEQGEEFNVHAPHTAVGRQKPTISALSNGGFILSWADSGDILGQVFDAQGHPSPHAGATLTRATTRISLPSLLTTSSQPLDPDHAGIPTDISDDGQYVLGRAHDRFGRQRGVRWERTSNGNYVVRDLGNLPGKGEGSFAVTPRSLSSSHLMLGSAKDSNDMDQAVISWDGGLLNINDLLPPVGSLSYTEAIGLTTTSPGTVDIVVNGSDNRAYSLTFKGLLRTDAQALTHFSAGPGGSNDLHYIARSGIGINGHPTTEILTLSPTGTPIQPTPLQGSSVLDLDGMVDGSLQWFALQPGAVDDLFAMGRVNVMINDGNNDSIIDDRDVLISETENIIPRDVVKIYRNTGSTFSENRILLDRFSFASGPNSNQVFGNLEFQNDLSGRSITGLSYNIQLAPSCAPLQSGREISLGAATVNPATDQFTLINHGLVTGSQISFVTTKQSVSMPQGLASGRFYWVRRINDNLFSLHSSALSATQGTQPINITSSGSGSLAWRLLPPVQLGTAGSPQLNDLVDLSEVTVKSDGAIQLTGSLPSNIVDWMLRGSSLRMTAGSTNVDWQPALLQSGLSRGDVGVGDLDGDGDQDFVLSGYGTLSRRTAAGAIVPIPETRIYETLEANHLQNSSEVGTTVLRDITTTLPGLANGSIELVDVNSDGLLDLILTGEDLFIDDNPERFSAQEQVGGNPNTSIFLNRTQPKTSSFENIDPTAPTIKFENALFPVIANDSRWASFDYRFRTDQLGPGIYSLRAIPLDHGRSDVILAPESGLPSQTSTPGLVDKPSYQKLNGQILKGTATENLFILANSEQDFYDINNEPVTIEGFNPFLDRILLRDARSSTADKPHLGFAVRQSSPNSNQLEIYRADAASKTVVRLPGLSNKDLIKFSDAFSQGNVIFSDYNQAENPFILSPVDGQLRDASAQTGFIVGTHGTDASEKLNARDHGATVKLGAFEVRDNYYVRLLRRSGIDLSSDLGYLTGGGGNDTLLGGMRSNDTSPPVTYIDGGSGNDRLLGSNLQAQIDLLLGQEGNDLLIGLAGRNLLLGQDGDDTLKGGLNSDSLFGGSGEDILDGAGAADTADYSQAGSSGIRINLSQVNTYRQPTAAPQIKVDNDGDEGQDWISLARDYLLTSIVAQEIITTTSQLRLPGHGLPDGARVRLRPKQDSVWPRGHTSENEPIRDLSGVYYIKAESVDGSINPSNDLLSLYLEPALTNRILITSPGTGVFDLLGDISSIENVVGSAYADQIKGDRQRNSLNGGAGNDTILGGLDRDVLDGGPGNDSLDGGEGSDTLIGGGGQDLLSGGSGDDIYILGSTLLTLEQAFEALGGRLSDLTPIPVLPANPARLKPITYEQFMLLADAKRWTLLDGKPQFERFRALGLEPDLMLFERAKLDPSQGWLRAIPGGSRIEAGVAGFGGNDVVYLDSDQLISLQGPQLGQIGLAQSGTNLVIDFNRDGVAEDGVQQVQGSLVAGNDITIKDFFKSNGTEAGENDVSLRVRGLQASYFEVNASDTTSQPSGKAPKLQRVDRQIDFTWAASGMSSDSLRPIDGPFSVVWDGFLQPSSDGSFRFRLLVDGQVKEPGGDFQLFVAERLLGSTNSVPLKSSELARIRLSYIHRVLHQPVSLELQWANGNQPFQTIPHEQFSTSQTIVANDVLSRSREFVPELSDAATDIGSNQISDYRVAGGWISQVRLADFDGDTLPDLFLMGRDTMGQTIATVYTNRAQILRVVDVGANTVDPQTDRLFLPGHGLKNGETIRFEAPSGIGDQLPDGLESNLNYIVRKVNDNQIQLFTPSNASPVDLTGTGSGRLRYFAPADRFTLADPAGKLFTMRGFDELVTASDIDLDQDGDLDLVALVRNATSDGMSIGRDNKLLAYLNDGRGHFTTSTLPLDLSSLPVSGELRALFADLDHDGRPDFTVAWDEGYTTDRPYGNTRLITWFTGGGTLLQATDGEGVELSSQAFANGIPRAVDLNADGQLELILSGRSVISGLFSQQGILTKEDKDGRLLPWTTSKASGKRERLKTLLQSAGITPAPGKRYRISLSSPDFDPFLQVMANRMGDLLAATDASDDDSGSGLNSELIFQDDGNDPWLQVSSHRAESTGRYSLTIEEITQRTVVYSWNEDELKPVTDQEFFLTNGAEYALQADVDLDGSQEILLGGARNSLLASVDSFNLNQDKLVLSTKNKLGALPSSPDASAQWIDQDNDGDLDLFFTLQTEEGPVSKVFTNPVIGIPSVTTFQELGTLLPGLLNASAAWADVDGDTDLDLVLSGAQGRSGTPYLQLFRNTTVDRDRNGNRIGRQNSAPRMNLTGLQASISPNDGKAVRLSWMEAFATGEEPYTYNLRLGTTSRGNQIISSLARTDGIRLVSQPGNNGQAFSRELPLWALSPGQRHFWSLQTIDNGFLGSPFSSEKTFVVNPMAPSDETPAEDPGDVLDLVYLYDGQTLSSPSQLNISFTGPSSGFQGTGATLMTSTSTIAEGSTLTLTFRGAGLSNYALELRVTGTDIDTSDFSSIGDAIISSTGASFTYALANDWLTEGVQNVTFQLYGRQPSTSAIANETWSTIGNAVNVSISDTSLTPEVNASIFDLNGDGNQDNIAKVDYPDRSVLSLASGARYLLPSSNSRYQFVNFNLDARPDLLIWSGTSCQLFRGDSDAANGFQELLPVETSVEIPVQPPFIHALSIDANTDGLPDLWLSGEGGVRLFENQRLSQSGNESNKYAFNQHDFNSAIDGVQPLISTGDTRQMLSGDFDADGDNDLLLSNSTTLRLFENNLGVFTETALLANRPANAPLPLTAENDLILIGDSNNDGRTDLLLLNPSALRLFRNTESGFLERDVNGNASGKALQAPTGLSFRAATWFDADHDGRLDIAAGFSDGSVRIFHQQDGVEKFREYINQPSQTLPSLNRLEAHDMDSDGDLDLIAYNASGQQRQIENLVAPPNDAPAWNSSSDNLFSTIVSGQTVHFYWSGAQDDHTPSSGLRYTLRVGTAAGLGDVFSSPSGGDDQPLLEPLHGNVGTGADQGGGRRGWTLNNLNAGNYYWSVQAIDGSGRASAFSPEQQVQVLPTLSMANILCTELNADPTLPRDQVRLVLPSELNQDVALDPTAILVSDGVTIPSPLSVVSMLLSNDHRSLILTLNRPVAADQPLKLTIHPGTDLANNIQGVGGVLQPAIAVETRSRNLELLRSGPTGLSVTEGDNGPRIVTLHVFNSFANSAPTTVDYDVFTEPESGDSAEASSDAPDFLATSGRVVIPANQLSASFSFTVVGDTRPEGTSERFRIRLSNPSGVQLNTSTSELLVSIADESSDGAPLPSIDLKPEAVTSFSNLSARLGDRKELIWEVVNLGTANGGQPFNTEVWLSTDAVADTGDRFLGRTAGLVPSAGGSQRLQMEVDLLSNIQPGQYKLLLITNPEGLLLREGAPLVEKSSAQDSDAWANNQLAIDLSLVGAPLPDLAFGNHSLRGTFKAGSLFAFTTRIQNFGAICRGQWQLKAYLSEDAIFDEKDVLLAPATRIPSRALDGGSTSPPLTFKYRLPIYANGNYHFIAVLDSPQGDQSLPNNELKLPVSVTAGTPLITVSGFADHLPPSIQSTRLLHQSVAAGVRLQADKTLKPGRGNRSAAFDWLTVPILPERDTVAPQMSHLAVKDALLSVVLNEPLPIAVIPDPKAFSLQVSGVATPVQVSDIHCQGNLLQLKLSQAVLPNQVVALRYMPSADTKKDLRDAAGNRLLATAPLAVANMTNVTDTQAPNVLGLEVRNLMLNGELRGQLSLILSEPPRRGLALDPSEFMIHIQGSGLLPVTSASIDGTRVVLTLPRAIHASEHLKLKYKPGSDIADDLQDDAPLWAKLYRIDPNTRARTLLGDEAISSRDTSKLRFHNNQLTLVPTDGPQAGQLRPGQSYELELPRGFVTDLAGNPQANTLIRLTTLPEGREPLGTLTFSLKANNIGAAGSLLLSDHGLVDGSVLRVSAEIGSALPTGLNAQDYFVKVLTAQTIELHRNKALSDRVVPAASGAALLTVVALPDPQPLSPNLRLERAVSNAQALFFQITRLGRLNQPTTVFFSLSGTATPNGSGADYNVGSNAVYNPTTGRWSATFPADVSELLIKVQPKSDSEPEPSETVILTLLSGDGYQLSADDSSRSLSARILDDDVPSNDSFAHPTLINVSQPLNPVSNRAATSEAGEPLLGDGPNNHTLWWKLEASSDGLLILTTQGSEADTRLALLEQTSTTPAKSPADLKLLEINAHGAGDGGGLIRFQAKAKTTYYVMADSENNSTGNVQLRLDRNSVRMVGVDVVEGLNSTARVSIQLERNINSTESIEVNYQARSGTATLGEDFGSNSQNTFDGEVEFPVWVVDTSAFNPITGEITLGNHGLSTLDQVVFRANQPSDQLPLELKDITFFVKALGNTIKLYNSSSLLENNRLNFNRPTRAVQLVAVEKGIQVPIIDDNKSEFDERFTVELGPISQGQALIEVASASVVISDLLTFEGNGRLPGQVENGQILDTTSSETSLFGNSRSNQLIGNEAVNTLFGLGGSDLLVGGPGDRLIGGAGNDRYLLPASIGAAARPTIVEENPQGNDTLLTGLDNISLDAFPYVENLQIIGSLGLTGLGSSGNNRLIGSIGDDSLYGKSGNDTLTGGEGQDSLIGGPGDDLYLLLNDGNLDSITEGPGEGKDAIQSTVSINLRSYSYVENVLLRDIPGKKENSWTTTDISAVGSPVPNLLVGSRGNNSLAGLAGNDSLSGGAGNDTLMGGAGNDRLSGGMGVDRLTGQAGADTFCFDTVLNGETNRDLLTDFNPDQGDRIELSHSVFPALTQLGTLPSTAFAIGSATTTSQRLLYAPNTGILTYDSNGSSAGGDQMVAVLPKDLSNLTSALFQVI